MGRAEGKFIKFYDEIIMIIATVLSDEDLHTRRATLNYANCTEFIVMIQRIRILLDFLVLMAIMTLEI